MIPLPALAAVATAPGMQAACGLATGASDPGDEANFGDVIAQAQTRAGQSNALPAPEASRDPSDGHESSDPAAAALRAMALPPATAPLAWAAADAGHEPTTATTRGPSLVAAPGNPAPDRLDSASAARQAATRGWIAQRFPPTPGHGDAAVRPSAGAPQALRETRHAALPAPPPIVPAVIANEQPPNVTPRPPIPVPTTSRIESKATAAPSALAMLADAIGVALPAGPGPASPIATAPIDATTTATPDVLADPAGDDGGLAGMLGRRLRFRTVDGRQQAVVRLEPDRTGSVRIEIRHQAGALQVHLSASNDELLRQLHGISDGLRQELGARQYTEVRVQVGQAPHDGASQEPPPRHPRDGRRAGTAAPGRALAADGEHPARFTSALARLDRLTAPVSREEPR